MKNLASVLPYIVFAFAALITLVALSKIGQGTKKLTPIFPKTPITKNEQPLYFRLVEAFPEHVVLAQVAFSALLQTKAPATRNKFDRKVADFVICTKSFDVLAVSISVENFPPFSVQYFPLLKAAGRALYAV